MNLGEKMSRWGTKTAISWPFGRKVHFRGVEDTAGKRSFSSLSIRQSSISYLMGRPCDGFDGSHMLSVLLYGRHAGQVPQQQLVVVSTWGQVLMVWGPLQATNLWVELGSIWCPYHLRRYRWTKQIMDAKLLKKLSPLRAANSTKPICYLHPTSVASKLMRIDALDSIGWPTEPKTALPLRGLTSHWDDMKAGPSMGPKWRQNCRWCLREGGAMGSAYMKAQFTLLYRYDRTPHRSLFPTIWLNQVSAQ